MSEFKISRLRFSWAGPWRDQTFFNKDEIVQFNGKAYVCLIPHTSNNFYSDLGAAEPKWELMMTGQTWKGPWNPLTQYALDNIVIFGGIVYKCNEQHLSGAVLDLDIDKWDVYAESKTWASEWTSSTTYGVGSIVNYGGSVYECIVSHVSAATDLEGLEEDYTDVEDSTEKYWKLLQYGVSWRGEYATESQDSSQIRYKLNDIVKYGPSLYRCIWGHAPTITPAEEYGLYTSTAITNLTGNGSNFFKRELTVNGVRIVAAGDVGGQAAVPDAFVEKVAQTFKILINKDGAGINSVAQEALINTLSGAAGTYHAAQGPTLQRVARGAGGDYSTNFLTDDGITFWNLSPLFDSHVANDMVWYLNSTGDPAGNGDTDAQEVLEHVMHTIHMHGLDAVSLKMYPYISADWATGPLYAAMVEAYDGGFWDPSGYGGDAFKTDGDAFEVAAKEYLYLLNFCMFDYSTLWPGDSLAPEWADTVKTPAGIQVNLPLGYALFNTYISPVISKPSLATIRSIFGDGDIGDPTIAGASGYVVEVNEDIGILQDTFDSSYWEEWLPGLDFDGVYDANVIYQPGDVVQYGGYLFQSKVINNIGNKPSTNFGDDSTDAWELITEAYEIAGTWDSATEFKVGNVVRYGGDLYVALVDSVNENPGNFTIQAPYEAENSSGTRIQVNLGDSVASDLITVGMTVTGEGFSRGQTVESVSYDDDSSNASMYATVILNEAPDGPISDEAVLTFSGARTGIWELLIPGFNWEGKWSDGTLYNLDDVIYWKNATYRAVREHTSSFVSRPDNDLQNAYWSLYLQHDQRNTLSEFGEMIIFDGENNAPLTTGADGNVLKVVNGLPTWSDIDFTPNVYYVATNGEDLPTNGTTPDTAWKTVKYACERVKLGTMRQNAKVMLEQNKDWIVQQTFYWFLYQQNQNIAPFDQSYNFDNEKTSRDAELIIDGVIRDVKRGGNAQTVRATLSYFDLESTNKFTNATVAEQAEFFIAFFVELFSNIELAITNTAPAQNYQVLEGVENPVAQYFNNGITIEDDAVTFVQALERILLDAFVAGSPSSVPPENQGTYSTINIKSGTYNERLPIKMPPNTALNGDELRGTTIQPAAPVNTLCTRTLGFINQFIVGSTVNMENNTPVQFVSLNPVEDISTVIGGVIPGKTYYVIGSTITDTTFSVSEVLDGPAVELTTNIGAMYVYGGEALGDMIQVTNDCGVRNMTVKGLLGTLSVENEYLTRRPTGGAYVGFDPGEGPDDTSVWITARSPYIQNVTTFGKGCTGCKIDSTLHNGGNRSMVSNDFTQIISDGIGIWARGGDALTECVSVFSYYNYAGYFAEDGARIRATNGNSSYGTFGCVAEGFDIAEVPATGTVNNRNNDAVARPVSALGAQSEVLKIEYEHAGEEYYTETTNLLKQSNNLLAASWQSDGEVSIVRANTTPYDGEFAWKVTANTSLTDSSYISQNVTLSPQGRTYTNIAGTNVSGSGIDATFNVTVFSERYEVTINNSGSGYVVGNEITLDGRSFGGRTPENDITITVQDLSITAISGIDADGIVPTGSALPYTVSVHVKQGTANYIDFYNIFSGFAERTLYARFNFATEEVTTQTLSDGISEPFNLQANFLDDGWWRIQYTIVDETAQNTQLQFKIYPRGIDGIQGYTNIYGAQIETGDAMSFFLETYENTPTSYANVLVQGAGKDARVIANELRSGSIYQSRILESTIIRKGGLGYNFQSNNAQGGNEEYLVLAQSEVSTAAEYEGMRLSVSSGKGAGQYGIISNYNPITKFASITKESFGQQEVVAADAVSNRLLLGSGADFHRLYTDQAITFTPTTYNIDIISSSQSQVTVVGTRGDLNNTMVVTTTERLRVGQKINFSGPVFGGVITNFDYYIIDVIDDTDIQLSTSLGGAVWPLTNVNVEDAVDEFQGFPSFTLNYPDGTSFLEASTTDNMEVTLPIQFTGRAIGGIELGDTYYIHDVYENNKFSISTAIREVTVTATSSADNSLTISDTSIFNPLDAIIFKDGVIGGIQDKQRYYVKEIINGTNFTITSALVNTIATTTEAVTNLITVTSTAGFIAGNPIMFTGITFGGIVSDTVYYIQVVNDATSFTISATPGGAAVALTSSTGEVIVRSATSESILTNATGSIVGTSPGGKEPLEAGRDLMEGSFFTEIFGGITSSTTYYVKDKFEAGSIFEITITDEEGGVVDVSLIEETGSMQINAVGWDHINPGFPLVSAFDSTSVYEVLPRIEFSLPDFYQLEMTGVEIPEFTPQTIISNGFLPIAIPRYGAGVFTTTEYSGWDTEINLPIEGAEVTLENPDANGGWVDGCYGNGTWFLLSETGKNCLYSVSDGLTWLSVDLPTLTTGKYQAVTYGNGVFVAIARGEDTAVYSLNNCSTWTAIAPANGLNPNTDFVDIAYGKETFVIIDGSSDDVYSWGSPNTSIDAWALSDIDDALDSTVNNWRTVKYGNGRFVAVSESDRSAAYSFDGVTWYKSTTPVSGTALEYGQGLFVVINNTQGICCTSYDGLQWDVQPIISESNYATIGFTFDAATKKGWFLTLDETGTIANKISGGARAQANVEITGQSITKISMFEPGSGYEEDSFGPNITINDPNNSEEALVQLRIGDGTLGAPTFVNFGNGYNTTSTGISLRGSGFSDQFQEGLRLIASDITRFPGPGDNLQFNGSDQVYRVATAIPLRGTTTPNLEAIIQLSPQVDQEDSPIHNTPFTIRSRFSQVRLTNHDFLNIGFGNEQQSNYPDLPEDTGLEPQDEIQETNNGRVFYSSTDQDGNFRVGDLFAVEQATGIVTLSADEFGLDGLTELAIGGVALGGSPVTINAFSTDGTFVANSNNLVPTQRAIRTYLASRLSQGGADTFTGLLQAGTVKVGGPDIITSSVAEGGEGWQVKIPTKAMFDGPFGNSGWAGDGLAMSYFMKTLVDPTRGGQQ